MWSISQGKGTYALIAREGNRTLYWSEGELLEEALAFPVNLG